MSRALMILFLAVLASSMLSAVTQAQSECITDNSYSPRTVNYNLVMEQPLIYPVGVVNTVETNPKFATFSGYDIWSIPYGDRILSNFIEILSSSMLVTDKYYSGSFVLSAGSYRASGGRFYWSSSITRLDVGSGVVAVLDVFDYVINDTQPSVQELQDAVLLDIAPSFALHLVGENGTEETYVGKAVFVVPSALLSFMDYVSSSGGSISYVREAVFARRAQVVISGSGGYFNILYMVNYEVGYVMNGTGQAQGFRTILYVHGKFSTNGSVAANFHLLDLTEYNGYILKEAYDYSEPIGTLGIRYKGAIDIGFTLVNASDPGQVVFSDYAELFMYGDWIGVVQRQRTINDIIIDTNIGEYNIGADVLLLSLNYYGNPEFYAVGPSMSRFVVNMTYLSQALAGSGYTLVNNGGISFLPVVWADKVASNYTINKAGMAAVFAARVNSSEGVGGLLIVPRFYGDQQLLENAPPAYGRLLNGGTPYIVVLPDTWSRYSSRGLNITGWHIVALVEDPNGVFHGTETKLAPMLAVGYSLRPPQYTFTSYDRGVSFDLADIIMNSPRVNLTSLDPARLIIPAPLPQLGSFASLLKYMFGGTTWAAKEGDLPPSWITVPAENMTVNSTSKLFVEYMDDVLGNYFRPFALFGNSVYQTQDPDAPPTMMYNVVFNNLTGTPLLSMNIYGASGAPQLETLFVTSVLEAPDPTLGKLYADGVSPSIITYAVGAQFQAIPAVPSDIPIPVISNGILFVSRQGYTWNGIMVVGAVVYVHLDKDIETVSSFETGSGHTVAGAGYSWLRALLDRILVIAEASSIGGGQLPPCDIVMPGLGLCANLTDSPGTAIVELNSFDTLGKLFVLDTAGSAKQIIAYYYDPNAKILLNKTICDGDCLELQSQSPCKAIVIPYTDTSLSPQNRLALVKIVYQQSGGGAGGGGVGGIVPPPPANVSLPEHGYISAPSLTTPKGLMTLALFVAFYVYYNQKMSHAQALVVSTALTGLLSVIIWGPRYLTTVLIIFGVGLALYYVLGK